MVPGGVEEEHTDENGDEPAEHRDDLRRRLTSSLICVVIGDVAHLDGSCVIQTLKKDYRGNNCRGCKQHIVNGCHTGAVRVNAIKFLGDAVMQIILQVCGKNVERLVEVVHLGDNGYTDGDCEDVGRRV